MAEAVIAVGTAVLVFVAFGQLVTFYRQLPQNVVAGGRFELYSAYPIRVPAVPASVTATG